jgi:hypothetical protein
MYIDPNKYYADGTLVQDPTRVINAIPSSGSGIFSQINTDTHIDPFTSLALLEQRMTKLEFDNKCLRLKMLKMEGKFTQDEVTNIRKMLISEDESSRTLAESIIENA